MELVFELLLGGYEQIIVLCFDNLVAVLRQVKMGNKHNVE